MKVVKVEYRNFRCFESLTLYPQGHVCVVGEPGSGKTTIIEGLIRALTADYTRTRHPSELDLYKQDRSLRAEVEVTLSALGEELEQAFFDHLEIWDRESKAVVGEIGDATEVDGDIYDSIVRICYRAKFDIDSNRFEHWVDFPKYSDPDAGTIANVPYKQRLLINSSWLHGKGPLIDIGATGRFRELVNAAPGEDFNSALQELESAFSSTKQMAAALDKLLQPCRIPLKLEGIAPEEIFTLLPEGGSTTGILRSLSPAVDLHDGTGMLPLQRHGSTVNAMLRTAQALANAGSTGIILMDDFGEEMDSAIGLHFASILHNMPNQVWVSTRRANVAEAFAPDELIRLARDSGHRTKPFHGRVPVTKQERLAARHRNLQLLPAIGSKAIAILEGPHDKNALLSLASKLNREDNFALPAATGITIIDAGIVDGSGGSSAIPRLAALAREMGWFVVSVIDNDKAGKAELEENLKNADVVIRLPPKHAIETALVSKLDNILLRDCLKELSAVFSVKLSDKIDDLNPQELSKEAQKFLKQSGGLHSQFVDLLPPHTYPPVAKGILEAIESAVSERKAGLIQL